MNESELIKLIQNHFLGYSADIELLYNCLNEVPKVDKYRIKSAVRLIRSYNSFIENKLTKYDFESALRQFLILFNTGIKIPGYCLSENNPFGLYSEAADTISVSMNISSYLNKKFVYDAFMKNYSSAHIDEGKKTLTNGYIKSLTGYESYRSYEQQLAVIGALKVPDGYTALVAMLTGGGKSLITQAVSYQKSEGLTIVVVPTISLMLDQVRAAKTTIKSDVENEIFYYHSNCDTTKLVAALHNKTARMLFISPETLIKNDFLKSEIMMANEQHYLKNFIVDEAHIIIEWGASFRVDFQCLDALQKRFLETNPQLRTYLLSATYTSSDVRMLKSFFASDGRWIELRFDKLRKEPRYNIIKADNYYDKNQKIFELVCTLPRPMIIYVNSPDDAENLKTTLTEFGFSNLETFTGKTSSDERERLINDWVNDKFDLMIATCAFGVGVDKKDVRTVLHLYVPSGPNQYYQECGRGGRDGLSCLAIMLYTNDDIQSAYNLSQKVITTDKFVGRWISMLESNKTTIGIDETRIDTAVRPNFLDSDEFFVYANNADVAWNVYVILLLRRYGLIEIKDIEYKNDRYFFYVRLVDSQIRFDSDYTRTLFESIRNKEKQMIGDGFFSIKSALSKSSRICISDLFNSVYKLTDEYCAGCNSHENVIDCTNDGRVLKLTVSNPVAYVSDSMRSFSDEQKEMMIYSQEQDDYLYEFLSEKGLDIAVVKDVDKFRTCNASKNNSTLNIISYTDFFALVSERNNYYTSGSIAFFIDDDQITVERILTIREKLSGVLIYISPSDIYVPSVNKYLSEVINGSCLYAGLLKGDN